MPVLEKPFDIAFSIGIKKVLVDFDVSFSFPHQVGLREFNVVSGFAEGKLAEFNWQFGNSTQFLKEFDINCKSLDNTPKIREFSVSFANRDVVATIYPITTVPVVVINGRTLATSSVVISNEEDRSGHTASITLANSDDLAYVKRDDTVKVTVGTKVFRFIVDTLPKDKDGIGARTTSVNCVSTLMAFDEPRAPKMTKTWEKPVQASSVASELLGLVVWDTVDWVIPEYRLAVEGQTPLQVVEKIAEACGAIVTTTADGTALVQSKYLVNTDKYDEVTPDFVFNDIDHIMTDTEEGVPQDGTNYVLVSDVSVAESGQGVDQLEFDVSGTGGGLLSVYPSPVRELKIEHTAKEPISIVPVTDLVASTKEETVEIYKGEAKLRYPIDLIENIDFISLEVTGLRYEQGSSVLYTENLESYGVVKVTYKTQVKQYRVSGVKSPQVQFLLKEI